MECESEVSRVEVEPAVVTNGCNGPEGWLQWLVNEEPQDGAQQGRSAREIFGSPDDRKLLSCATLFAQVSPPGSVFEGLLEKYYEGEQDARTLEPLMDSAT